MLNSCTHTKSGTRVNLFDTMNENKQIHSSGIINIPTQFRSTKSFQNVCGGFFGQTNTRAQTEGICSHSHTHNCRWKNYATDYWPSELHVAPARGQRSPMANQAAQTGRQRSKWNTGCLIQLYYCSVRTYYWSLLPPMLWTKKDPLKSLSWETFSELWFHKLKMMTLYWKIMRNFLKIMT